MSIRENFLQLDIFWDFEDNRIEKYFRNLDMFDNKDDIDKGTVYSSKGLLQ